MRRLLAAAALGAVAACVTSTPPGAAAPTVARVSTQSGVTCDIRATSTAHGVAIGGLLNADQAISGNYNLVITKIGASGSSDISQAGPFSAARGERVTLGETELTLDRGDRFRAVLTLTDAGGLVCRKELRS